MGKGISDLALSVFCRNMGMMLAAGIEPEEAVTILIDDVQQGPFEALLQELARQIGAGKGLALAAKEAKFPENLTLSLELGESSGKLEEAFASLADSYEGRDRLHKRLKGALLYPVVLLLLLCVVLAVLVFAVLPVFAGVYENLSGGLIGTSYGYVMLAAVIGRTSLIVVALICALVLCGVGASYTRKGRLVVLAVLRRMPVAGKALLQFEIARLTRILTALMSSGMDSDGAMDAAAGAISDPRVKQMVMACKKDMEAGSSLAQSFQKNRVLEPLYGRMLLSGSRAGQLEQTMSQLSVMLGQDAEDGLCTAIETIEPVLTGFLTLAVGLTLLCAMLPLVGILSAIG